MKRLFLIIALIIITTSLHALEFYSYGEFGYYTSHVSAIHTEQAQWSDASIGAGIDTGKFQYGIFNAYLEAELRTDMYKVDRFSFKPVQQDYYVRLGAWIGPINFKIEHLCKHSVDSYNPLINGGHDRVSIGFDSRRLK